MYFSDILNIFIFCDSYMQVKLIVFFFLLITNSKVFAQTYILPQISYHQFKLYGTNYIDKWYVFSFPRWEEGTSIGACIRHHIGKMYLQGGINLADHTDAVGIVNTQVERIPVSGSYLSEWSVGSITQRMIRLEMPISAGYEILKYRKISFRTFAEIMPSYRFKEGHTYTYNPNYSPYAYIRQTIVIQKVANMYVPFALDAAIGAGIDIGRFTLDVRRSQGLTNLANDVEFEGKTYPFRWRSKQLTFTLGWKFRIDKNRPRKHKKNAYF
jgi:hypothetical protein